MLALPLISHYTPQTSLLSLALTDYEYQCPPPHRSNHPGNPRQFRPQFGQGLQLGDSQSMRNPARVFILRAMVGC